MAKKRKAKPTFDGHTFDSDEELEFYHWLAEAKQLGFVDSFVHPVESYILSDSVKAESERFGTTGQRLKPKTVTVIRPHKYTPDFEVKFTELGQQMLTGALVSWTGKDRKAKKPIDFRFGQTLTIDIKGLFNGLGGGSNSEFRTNRCWMYREHLTLVQRVVPECLFLTSWVPEAVRWTPKTKKLRAKYSDSIIYVEMLGIIQRQVNQMESDDVT